MTTTEARPAGVLRLYRYQSFMPSQADDIERLRTTISENKIYMSRPNSFNDPWDCRPWYNTDVASDPKIFEKNLRSYAALTRRQFPGLPVTEIQRRAEIYRQNPTLFSDCIPRISADMWETINHRYRVYCLSSRADSELLWAHYGRSHTGICLEFASEQPPLSGALKVSYQNNYPAYDWDSEDLDEVLSVLLTKSDAWSYEDEFRLILQMPQFVDDPRVLCCDSTSHFQLPAGTLKRIIFGCLVPQQTIVVIEDLVRRHGNTIMLARASMAPDRYRILVPA